MSISMLAAIVAMQDELYKRPANIAAMMKWSDNPAVREWGLRLENALLREKMEADFHFRDAMKTIDKVEWTENDQVMARGIERAIGMAHCLSEAEKNEVIKWFRQVCEKARMRDVEDPSDPGDEERGELI